MTISARCQTTGSVTLALLEDTEVENDETLTLTLAATAARLTLGAAATVTITDNDGATLSFADTSPSFSEGAGGASIGLTLSAALPGDLEVTVSSAGDSATEGSDYTALSGTITISAGQTIGSVTLTLLDDSEVENDETLTLTLAASAARLTLGAAATVTITDNDSATLSFTNGDQSFSEGAGAVSIGLSLSAALPGDLEVTVTSAGVSATEGSDYTALSQAVTIAKGDTTGSVTLTLLEDTEVETEETLTLSVSASGAGLDNSLPTATLTITDNDGATLSFADTSPSFSEGDGGASIGLTLSAALPGDLEVTVSSAGDTATEGSDYTALSETLTISAGQTSGSVTLTLLDFPPPCLPARTASRCRWCHRRLWSRSRSARCSRCPRWRCPRRCLPSPEGLMAAPRSTQAPLSRYRLPRRSSERCPRSSASRRRCPLWLPSPRRPASAWRRKPPASASGSRHFPPPCLPARSESRCQWSALRLW